MLRKRHGVAEAVLKTLQDQIGHLTSEERKYFIAAYTSETNTETVGLLLDIIEAYILQTSLRDDMDGNWRK